MPDATRTFVAVSIPEPISGKVARLTDRLAAKIPNVRWSATMPYHVTLAFLGDVDHADLAKVCNAVAEEAAVTPPFTLALQGLGAFPDLTRPRVIWMGVDGPGVVTLHALQAAVARAVARCQYPTDGKPFHPHVTLGRAGGGSRKKTAPLEDLTTLARQHQPWRAGPFPVHEIVTFSSTLTREGPAYAPLGRARLKGGKPP